MTDASANAGRPQEFEKVLSGSDSSVASFDTHDKSFLEKAQYFLHANPAMVPLIVLVLSILVFGLILGGKFFSAFTLTLILQQVAITGIVGAAQTLVILTAGIDLSVGAIMVLSSVVMGQFTFRYGLPAPLSILCGFACGALCGYLNGLLVSRMRLPPFIVTLGTWSVYGSMVIYVSHSETIRAQDIEATAPLLQWLGHTIRFGGGAVLTYGAIAMILIAIVIWYVLNRTAFGRHVYATGDDPEAARLAGINTARTLIAVYTLAGFICAIASWVLIGRIGAASPLGNQTANLDAITAVVIGGTSLFGGRGSIVGTLFGALIVGVFRNGLALAGFEALWQEFTVAIPIILAGTIDQWIRKRSA